MTATHASRKVDAVLCEPPGEMRLGKIGKHLGRMRRDPDQRRGQANAVLHAFDLEEAQVGEMRLVATAPQLEVDRQAAEDIEAAAHPRDEQVLAAGELVEDGDVEFHFASICLTSHGGCTIVLGVLRGRSQGGSARSIGTPGVEDLVRRASQKTDDPSRTTVCTDKAEPRASSISVRWEGMASKSVGLPVQLGPSCPEYPPRVRLMSPEMPTSNHPLASALYLSLIATVLLLTTGDAEAAKCATPPISATTVGGTVVIEVDWLKLKTCTESKQEIDTRPAVRIDEDAPVAIKITNLNFVSYAPSFKVEETVVETYVALEKLWSQLLGLPLFTGGTARSKFGALLERSICDSFRACLADWAYLITTANIEVDAARTRYARFVALDDAQRRAVAEFRNDLATAKENIDKALKQLIETTPPADANDQADFETVYSKQQLLFDKIAAYNSAAQRVEDGQLHPIGKKKAGTIVVVSITPKDSQQAPQTPVVDVEYFVHSKLPLTFHLGYSASRIRDIDFESVRASGQSDLFVVVKDNETTSSMVAFLSLGRAYQDENVGAYASIGTDFSEPGKRVYVGGSVQLMKRLFLTVGGVSHTVQEGNNPVLEDFGGALGARELFGQISTRRDWARFWSISFRAF
jgi:hypothetical protein